MRSELEAKLRAALRPAASIILITGVEREQTAREFMDEARETGIRLGFSVASAGCGPVTFQACRPLRFALAQLDRPGRGIVGEIALHRRGEESGRLPAGG